MKNLKILRKSANLTLLELAEDLGTSAQVLSRYEREEHQADYNTLQKIANYFDVSIDYLLGFSTYYYPDNVKKSSSNLTSEEQELLNNYRSLPAPERAQASEYVNFLTERRGIKNKHA